MSLRRKAKIAMVAVLAATSLNAVAHFAAPQVSDRPRIVAQATHQADFWRTVSGASISKVISPDQTLALDLRQALGPVSSDARVLPPGIDDFRARGNTSYGGVTALLGVNPFTDEGCYECGLLTNSFKQQLLQVKTGHGADLIAGADNTKPPDWPLTPFGLPGWLTILILILTCVGIVAADLLHHKWQTSRQTNRLQRLYPRQMQQIGKADELLAIEPPDGYDVGGLRQQLAGIREKLAAEIVHQSSPAVPDDAVRIADYESQLKKGLAELQEGMNIDEDVRRELELPGENRN